MSKLGLIGFGFGTAALLALLAACSSEDPLGTKDGSQIGKGGNSGSAGANAGLLCKEPSPVGCSATGCPSGQTCNPSVGCAPSACGCDPATGTWMCTADCGGGTCVSDSAGLQCTDPNPAGCRNSGCPAGQKCDTTQGCAPSACGCDSATGTWTCTADCGGGVCVPDAAQCPGENPMGCKQTGCAAGQKCDTSQGCTASWCGCDPSTGVWVCTEDCGGGVCVSDAGDAGTTCSEPNPEGCFNHGCPSGQKCDTSQGCAPTGCGCDPSTGVWTCTADCSGGICVPE